MKTQIVLAALAAALTINAKADIYTVDGQSGPWDWANGGLNTGYQYGVNDQISPTVVTSIGGISIGSGQELVVTYVSGTVNTEPFGGFPNNQNVDANGISQAPNPDLTPHSNGNTPGYYAGESPSHIIYTGELLGTFANSSGTIVGNPFALGDGPTDLTVPTGATQLQLGVNDNLYSDNAGSWNIGVTMVPEPSLLGLLGVGVLGVWMRSRKR